MSEYDLAILGGGLVGGSLACALGRAGLRVCLIEAVSFEAREQPGHDERVLALSWGSRRILEGAGLWPRIEAEAEPIHQIQVSDRGRFGCTRLDQREEGVEALGYVVPAWRIGQAVQAGLEAVESLCPARLVGFRVGERQVELEVTVAGGESRLLRTALLVAADGGESALRQRLGFRLIERDYDQDALITTIQPDRPRPGVAFERFTDTGPLAFLPMTGGRYSVVWTTPASASAALAELDDSAFLARLQDRFGYRLGGLHQPGRRILYPLRLRLVPDPVRPRLVLIGNAAHTLHPVAGQGLNLGLRDLAALAQVTLDAVRSGGDPGAPATLEAYRRLRGRDPFDMVRVTDFLVRAFTHPWEPVRCARDLGLLGLDLLPAARHALARRFMGLTGNIPRLARGVPL